VRKEVDMASTVAVRFGPFRLYAGKRLLLRESEPVGLTPKAFDTLVLLIEQRDRVVSKRELLDRLWPDTAVEDATLSQHVFMLRRALSDPESPDVEYIATIQRRGYRFVAPVVEISIIAEANADAMPAPHVDAALERGRSRSLRTQLAVCGSVALLVAGAILVMTWYVRPPVVPPKRVHLAFVLAPDQQLWRSARGSAALSPDGRTVVYAADRQLYLRPLNGTDARAIPGTRLDVSTPFFSPAGAWIGFWSAQDSTLRKISIAGGTAIVLAPASNPRGASWFDDRVVVAEGGKGILVIPATGGTPALWAAPGQDEMLQNPQMLPGDAVLFTASEMMGNRTLSSNVVAYSRATGARKRVIAHATMARYVPSGIIVYAIGSRLFAARFDPRLLEIAGSPALLAEDLKQNAPAFDVSADGTLVYLSGSGDGDPATRALALLDFNGHSRMLRTPPASYEAPRVSPDGRRLAVTTDDDGGTIWIYEMAGLNTLRRLTFEGYARSPLWSPDGRSMAFGSSRAGRAGIFVQAADGSGTAERLTTPGPGFEHVPTAWAADGRLIVFVNVKGGIKDTIWTVAVPGNHEVNQIVAVTGSNQMSPALSPDGRWLAYSSEGDAGKSVTNVFVQPFPGVGVKYQVSANGGDMPTWSSDGERLFYQEPLSGRLVSVRIRTQPSFSVEDAVAVATGRVTDAGYDLVPGRGFVVPVPQVGHHESAVRSTQQIEVVLNSFEALQQVARRERGIGQ